MTNDTSVKKTTVENAIGELKYEFAKAPPAVLERNIRHVLADMGNNSMFTQTVELTTYCNVADYDYSDKLAEGWRVVRVSMVKYCGMCITPADKCGHCSTGYSSKGPGHIRIEPTPSGEYPLIIEAIVAPLVDLCVIPDSVVAPLVQELLDGVRSRMYRMSNKPWTDFNLGNFHHQQYAAGVVSRSVTATLQYSSHQSFAPPRII